MGLITKLFGTYSQRELKSIYPIVDKITALELECNVFVSSFVTYC